MSDTINSSSLTMSWKQPYMTNRLLAGLHIDE
jgi:hypothetical protein